MKKYQVILHPDPEIDLSNSFEWGCRAWGEKNARRWLWELRRALKIGSHQCREVVLSHRRAKSWVPLSDT